MITGDQGSNPCQGIFFSEAPFHTTKMFQHVYLNKWVKIAHRQRITIPLMMFFHRSGKKEKKTSYKNFTMDINDIEDDMSKEFTHDFFIKSQTAWRLNKKRRDSGWVYICLYIHSEDKNSKKAGKVCNKPAFLGNKSYRTYFGGIEGIKNEKYRKACKQHLLRSKYRFLNLN